MLYINTIEFYSAVKNNENYDISQTQRDKDCFLSDEESRLKFRYTCCINTYRRHECRKRSMRMNKEVQEEVWRGRHRKVKNTCDMKTVGIFEVQRRRGGN